MGIHVIKMPDLGEGIAECEVVAWRVQPGDSVKEDQVVADVMTDKATVEIPSPVHGTVTALGGKVGESLAVGAELIRLDVEGAGNFKGEAVKPAAAAGSGAAPAADEPADVPHGFVPEPQRVAAGAASVAAPPAPPAQPARPAAPAAPAPQGKGAGSPAAFRDANEKPLAAPAVRKRAWDMGIELQYVAGSGQAGRITHADLDAYVAGRRGGRAAHGAGQDGRYAELHGEEAVPLIGLRRKIAEKMQLSKRQIPHFTYVEEVDVTELEALRGQLNARYGDERGKLTLLPLLMRAVVLAIRKFPEVNARFDDQAGIVTRYQPVHLGIATQTDAGLMVPVIRNAEARDPWSSAKEILRLADAARTGKAARDELSGSTITITSLGPLGGIVSTPVINHPEVAIVGVNRILERPVVKNGGLVPRKLMNLSSSFDHRVIDGMVAAEFIQTVRGYLESPATLFVE
ncbi:branched-chain alpha-keto acid dehydrogenase subunit E2 [Massilia sp. WF1]|uniref:dihydrolipoamide acetyltransferase family protein n=1 Tax=unclassified Massilia TaxID=2609279 RepID=UPI00064B67FB|nr:MULTISPECIES: dihydrolipoamide acetyltransferase family protein [unclassified Massilia]ALK97432.1 branched-chain alpha-keto acid dehydrogenase subunit E2 [Massilia sp. WG5]KLU36613.1 branched-chain alpha-keto acid dehydrogenase subunit E2 [Massilia sp. WF1]